jgi:polyisoprenoid-binding protein YceI
VKDAGRTRAALLACALVAAEVAAEPRRFTVDPEASQVVVHVGRAGLFKFAGHEHEVVAKLAAGSIVADADDLSRSSVTLRFKAAELKVTGKGEPAGDVPKVQAKMEGPDVLDVRAHPEIRFASKAVSGRAAGSGEWELSVTGDLSVRGATRELRLPLRVTLDRGELKAAGRLVLKQKDYGITPVSVAGVVKVKNELEISYAIVARAER